MQNTDFGWRTNFHRHTFRKSSRKQPLINFWDIQAEFAESLMKLSELLMMCAFVENEKRGKRKNNSPLHAMLESACDKSWWYRHSRHNHSGYTWDGDIFRWRQVAYMLHCVPEALGHVSLSVARRWNSQIFIGMKNKRLPIDIPSSLEIDHRRSLIRMCVTFCCWATQGFWCLDTGTTAPSRCKVS